MKRTDNHPKGEKSQQSGDYKATRRRFLKMSSVASAGALASIYGLQTSNTQASGIPLSGEWRFVLCPPPYITSTTSHLGGIQPYSLSLTWDNIPYIMGTERF